MNLDSVVEARIHPAIGIARVGNSEEFFVGPEVSHPVPPPPGGYRDASGKLKRQAARFRVFGYDANGTAVAELTAENAEISWTVHVANKKAAWYTFDAALDLPEAAALRSPRRNSQIQGSERRKLSIDPGPRTVFGKGAKSEPFDTGCFFGVPVYLGELLTDEHGCLLFLGGFGKSGSPFPGYTLTTFANNPGWHDDTSDGPVTAAVRIGDRALKVQPAWVVTAPPNYSPDLVTPQTMYDVVYDACAGQLMPRKTRPSFTQDILPLLRQFSEAQWVNKGFLAQFGWQGPNDFMRPGLLEKLATPPDSSIEDPLKNDPYGELRRQIFYSFRDPSATVFEPLAWPPIYGDAFGSFDDPPVPRDGFTVTNTLYGYLSQWSQGNFDADYDPSAGDPTPPSIAELPSSLDRAALHWCMGGPFHPGCEMTWPMRHTTMYYEPFRLRHRPVSTETTEEPDYGEFLTQPVVDASDGPLSASGPGDITKWMAVPWQSDTASCRSGYPGTEFPSDPFIPTFWPSRVPNNVLTEETYRIVIDRKRPLEERQAAFQFRSYWLAPLGLAKPKLDQIMAMISLYGELAIVERRESAPDPDFPSVMYVATTAEPGAPRLLKSSVHADEGAPVSLDFAMARFGGLRRRNKGRP